MEEIKLRIWDKGKNRWLHGSSDIEKQKIGLDCISIFGETIIFGEILRDHDDTVVSLDRVKDLVPCLFTGLKAEKCKTNLSNHIYQYDIFRSEIDTDSGTEIQYNIVMWIWQRAAFYMIPACHYQILQDNNLEDDEDFEWLFEDANLYDFKIDTGLIKVGNVFENPELLKYNSTNQETGL